MNQYVLHCPYFIGDSAGLSDLWIAIAILEVSLVLVLAIGIFARKGCSSARGPSSTRCSRSRTR